MTGAGSALIDPVPFGDVPNDVLRPLADAIGDTEWIIHAASQDLQCLAELGLTPARLFDTELAGRLLNYPRVGLATLVEEMLGYRMRKEHSAVDWSKRPMPESWLHYAALDVELLIELRDAAGGPARGGRQGRVGAPGVRRTGHHAASRARARTRGGVRRASTGCGGAAGWRSSARSGPP